LTIGTVRSLVGHGQSCSSETVSCC
jgi:hypothetical protein